MKNIFITIAFCLSVVSVSAQRVSYFGVFAGGAGPNANTLQRASAIGYNARVSVNDGLVLGDTTLVKVGIGMSNPEYRLDVKGVFNMRVAFDSPTMKINDRNFIELDKKGEFVLNEFKIKYETEGLWSDKVFEQDYPLLSLNEVSDFIGENKHLPNIPSAREVVEQGVSVNSMVSKLLEKVEELTLYAIQQQAEIDELKKLLNAQN